MTLSNNLGTFCGDGTSSLPINQKIMLTTKAFLILKYSLQGTVDVRFKFTYRALKNSAYRDKSSVNENMEEPYGNRLLILYYFYSIPYEGFEKKQSNTFFFFLVMIIYS